MNIQGFKVNFLGDSITEGVGVEDRDNCRYDNRLARLCGIAQVNNYGVGGTRLAHQTHPSDNPRYDLCFCGRAYMMDPTADMVIVYGGVNDFIHGDAPFGQMGDTRPDTFCGGVYYLMRFLRETYPGKPILFMTPARCMFQENCDDLAPSPRQCKLPDAQPLLEYVKVIQATARQFDIPVLDLYHNLGLDPHDPQIRRRYTIDGLHFNDEAHAIIAQRLKAFIDSL